MIRVASRELRSRMWIMRARIRMRDVIDRPGVDVRAHAARARAWMAPLRAGCCLRRRCGARGD